MTTMKKLAAFAAIAALFALAAPDTSAEAKVKFRIKDRHDHWKLSCNTARHKVREMGFKTVKIKSCISTIYSFYAVRNGRTHIFYVHSRTGFIWRG
jgi:invasion protein IalB